MANEVRLIDANALKKAMRMWPRTKQPVLIYTGTILKGIEEAPTIDPESLRSKGRWEPRKDAIGFVRCSVCHDCNIYGDWADGEKWRYCPNCGAKMEA